MSNISKLNTYCQKYKLDPPFFKILKKDGKDHCPSFQTCCMFENNFSIGFGSTFKLSKEDAAIKMVEILNVDQKLQDMEPVKVKYTISECTPPLIDIWENKDTTEYTLTLKKKEKQKVEYKILKLISPQTEIKN